MADPHPNLTELMEALEAERLKVEVVMGRIETYKQVIKNLNGIILAITDNMTVVGDLDAVTAALSTWRDTLQILKELDERDKQSGWPG